MLVKRMYYLNYIWSFVVNHGYQLVMAIVGCSALWVYGRQKKDQQRNAASLIILQIDDLQDRVQELQSYITDQGLNFTAFYESLLIFDVNYWDKYKNLLVRKIDVKSFNNINKLYQLVTSMQEQQQLVKKLQTQFFFEKEKLMIYWESVFILETLKEVDETYMSSQQFENAVNSPNLGEEQRILLNKLIKQIEQNNPNINMDRFWNAYSSKRKIFWDITNNNALTQYIPLQIESTLRNLLKRYSLLEISGTNGYNVLRKIAKMTDV